MSFSEPSPRSHHFSAAAEGELLLWGGETKNFSEEKRVLASSVHRFNPVQESWAEQKCSGPPPPALYWGACASAGRYFYFYGGTDETEMQCSLYQLDVRSVAWKQLSSAGPSKKTGCGMVTNGKTLVLFGGRGDPSGPTQPGAWWDERWTNELHTFNVEEGEGVHLAENYYLCELLNLAASFHGKMYILQSRFM